MMYKIKICLALVFATVTLGCSIGSSDRENSESVSRNDATVDTLSEARLVRTASIDLKVDNVHSSSQKVRKAVEKMGGLIMHEDIRTTELRRKRMPANGDSTLVITSHEIVGQLTLRVPVEKLNDLATLVAEDAIIIYQVTMDVDDRTADYLERTLTQAARRQLLNKAMNQDTVAGEDLKTIAGQQDAAIEATVQNLRTEKAVRYSTIGLQISQNADLRKETIPALDLDSYQPSFLRQCAQAIMFGINFIEGIVLGLLYIWPLVFLGAAAYLLYSFNRRKSVLKT